MSPRPSTNPLAPASFRSPLPQGAAPSSGDRILPVLCRGRAPRRAEVVRFIQQLAILVRAGVPVMRAVEVLGRQQKSSRFAAELDEVARGVRRGQPLWQAMADRRARFDPACLSMIRAGESAGALALVLERLAEFQEKSLRARARIVSALTYPAIVMLVATTIVVGLLVFVVPRFETIFAEQLRGQPLPALTQFVLGLVRTLGSLAWIIPIGLAAGGWLVRVGRRGGAFGRGIDRMVLHLPLAGSIVRKRAVARFSSLLGTLLDSGVSLPLALSIAETTAGNRIVAEGVAETRRRVVSGVSLGRSLAGTILGPEIVVTMVTVGEEVAVLPGMLARAGGLLEDEADASILRFTTLLEPAMIVMMALVVGVIVIALFLPILQIVRTLG